MILASMFMLVAAHTHLCGLCLAEPVAQPHVKLRQVGTMQAGERQASIAHAD